jgi:LysM repeat protein
MQPSSGVPSLSLYRGSLLALLVGVAVAVWLLVSPTSGDNGAAKLAPLLLTPTRAAGTTTPGATTPGATTPVATPSTPVATGTGVAPTATRPAGTGTPSATGTATSSSGDYTVVSGDTLSGICSRQRPSMASADCVAQIKTLNGVTEDIFIGQKLKLP